MMKGQIMNTQTVRTRSAAREIVKENPGATYAKDPENSGWIVTFPVVETEPEPEPAPAAETDPEPVVIAEAGKVEKGEVTVQATADTTKPLTRKQCVEALKAVGYTGPTSYLMPKLRAIVDAELAKAVDTIPTEHDLNEAYGV